jgi:hypothetical protein
LQSSTKLAARRAFSTLILTALLIHSQEARWSEKHANALYHQQPWLVGSNFLPSDAINQLEMWQATTFNPEETDRELRWAEGIGMNTMRVFLHNLLWEQDLEGFKKHIDQFLAIASKHQIRAIFVLLDSCWDPEPRLGPQRPPIPGVHNSGWVQAPGRAILVDPTQYLRLQSCVQGVVGAFASDSRILAWDMRNEPDNPNIDAYGKAELHNKTELVLVLLPQVFAWARSAHASQPLSSGVWTGDWSSRNGMSPMSDCRSNSRTSLVSIVTTGSRYSSKECSSPFSTNGPSSSK